MDRTRTVGTVVGTTRTMIGLASLIAPRRAARLWAGSGGDDPATMLFVRVAGGRDLVLGAATLAATGSDDRGSAASGSTSEGRRATVTMLQVGAVSDFADAVATLLGARHLDGGRRIAMPLLAVASGVGVLVAANWAVAADEDEETPFLSDEVRAKAAMPDEVDIRDVDRARI